MQTRKENQREKNAMMQPQQGYPSETWWKELSNKRTDLQKKKLSSLAIELWCLKDLSSARLPMWSIELLGLPKWISLIKLKTCFFVQNKQKKIAKHGYEISTLSDCTSFSQLY